MGGMGGEEGESNMDQHADEQFVAANAEKYSGDYNLYCSCDHPAGGSSIWESRIPCANNLCLWTSRETLRNDG